MFMYCIQHDWQWHTDEEQGCIVCMKAWQPELHDDSGNLTGRRSRQVPEERR